VKHGEEQIVMTRVEPIFYFDFGSPNAYLAHRVIPGIEAQTGVKFKYVPVLLGGLFKLSGNQAPMTAFANVPLKLAYQRMEMKRFIAKHNLTKFRMNPHFPVNTLGLMRTAVAAEAEGVLASYAEAMFAYMWEAPRKLDDPAILAQSLSDAGLPGERLGHLAQSQEVKDRLLANTQAAHEQGVFGIPSFLVGKELFFGKDTLRDVEEEIESQKSR
jgi:2-hydroxychromene-2-carboxylate isomerase